MPISIGEIWIRHTIASFTLGERVEVHSFGRWYAGTIVKIGRLRITVDYKAGRGAQRIKAFDLCRVRKLGTV